MPREVLFYGPTNQYVILTRLVRYGQCLTTAEFKVLMFIYDRTLGYRRDWESIPYRHFFDGILEGGKIPRSFGVGLGETALKKALRGLVEKEVVFRRRENNSWWGTYYSINTRWEPKDIVEMWAPNKYAPTASDALLRSRIDVQNVENFRDTGDYHER